MTIYNSLLQTALLGKLKWCSYYQCFLLSYIFNPACVYQMATWWDLPSYWITIWLIDWLIGNAMFVYLIIWFLVFITAIWHGETGGSELASTITLILQVNWPNKCASHYNRATIEEHDCFQRHIQNICEHLRRRFDKKVNGYYTLLYKLNLTLFRLGVCRTHLYHPGSCNFSIYHFLLSIYHFWMSHNFGLNLCIFLNFLF